MQEEYSLHRDKREKFSSDISRSHVERLRASNGIACSRIITYSHFVEFASGKVARSARSKTMAKVDRTCFVIYTIPSLSSGFPRDTRIGMQPFDSHECRTALSPDARTVLVTHVDVKRPMRTVSARRYRYRNMGNMRKKKEKEIPDLGPSSMEYNHDGPISPIVLYFFTSYTAIVINI